MKKGKLSAVPPRKEPRDILVPASLQHTLSIRRLTFLFQTYKKYIMQKYVCVSHGTANVTTPAQTRLVLSKLDGTPNLLRFPVKPTVLLN